MVGTKIKLSSRVRQAVGVSFVLFLVLMFVFRDEFDFIKRREKYQLVVDALKSGMIVANGDGRCKLPGELSDASVDEEIIVVNHPENKVSVIFKTWTGKGENMEGYMFVDQKYGKPSLGVNYYGEPIFKVDHVGFVIGKEVDKNWYKVSFRLD